MSSQEFSDSEESQSLLNPTEPTSSGAGDGEETVATAVESEPRSSPKLQRATTEELTTTATEPSTPSAHALSPTPPASPTSPTPAIDQQDTPAKKK